MSETFKHHEFNDEQNTCSDVIRSTAELLESRFHDYLVNSREKSLAITNLEQAIMWANKCIAIHGVKE